MRLLGAHPSTIAFGKPLVPPFAVDVRDDAVAYASGGDVVVRDRAGERAAPQRCVGHPVSLLYTGSAIVYADGGTVGGMTRDLRDAWCVARPAPEEPFRSPPAILAFGARTVLLVYGGATAVYVADERGRMETLSVPQALTGNAAPDASGGAWLIVADDLRNRRFGVCRMHVRAELRCFALPLASGGPVVAARDGSLWVSSEFEHTYAVLLPPPELRS